MNSRSIVMLALIVATGSQAELRAQDAPPLGPRPRGDRSLLAPGDIVRVTAPAGAEPLEGRVVGIRSDTLFLENVTAAAGETRIPLVSIANLEVKREPMARVGAVFGVLTGGVIGAAAAGELADDASSLIRNLAVVGGATIGGLGGYWAGSTIHKAIAGPRWVEVPVGRLQVGVGRLPRLGVGLRVGYSF